MSKKIISLALVIVMLFSFTVPSFAASTTTRDVEAKALEAAQTSFTNNGLTDAQVEAAVVTSCEVVTSGILYTTYTATVQSGLIYYYTCTITVGNITGIMIADNGLYATSESTGLTFFNSLFEFFYSFASNIFSAFQSILFA